MIEGLHCAIELSGHRLIRNRARPLLGVGGVAIVGHGRSSARAVRNGVLMAHRFAVQSVIQRIEGKLAAFAVPGP